jgi:hypothetical protein
MIDRTIFERWARTEKAISIASLLAIVAVVLSSHVWWAETNWPLAGFRLLRDACQYSCL